MCLSVMVGLTNSLTMLMIMSAAGPRYMFCLVPVALFSLLVTANAKRCARLYIPGLDSTTTTYPQLAGVYVLKRSVLLSDLVSLNDADLQFFLFIIRSLILFVCIN